MRFFALIFCCILGPALTRAASTHVLANAILTDSIRANSMEANDDKHKLVSGDRLSFRIVQDREEPKQLTITESGELDVPYLGRVPAASKTCKQLAVELKELLEKDLYYHASVIIKVDAPSQNRGKIYLVGQVRVPGAQDIPIDEDFSVSKAILKAGGFSDFADRKHVKITRKKSPLDRDNQVIIVDVTEVWEKGRTEKDVKLEPGDLLFIPARLLNF